MPHDFWANIDPFGAKTPASPGEPASKTLETNITPPNTNFHTEKTDTRPRAGAPLGGLTDLGFRAVAGLSGTSVKVLLWVCLNAYPNRQNQSECRIRKSDRKALGKTIGRGEQTIVNCLTELVRAGIIKRTQLGHYIITPSIGGRK